MVVDYGDAFARAPEPHLPPNAVRERALLFVDAFNRMGMQAYTLGERDLSLGLELLRELAGRAKFRLLAANLLNADGQPLFERSLIVELGGRKIGLLGLLGARAAVQPNDLTALGATLEPPAKVAAAEVARLQADGAELVVVLSHLGPGEEAEVLRAAPAIRFFIGGHSGRQLERPMKLDEPQSGASAWVFEAGNRGKHQGRLELYVSADGGSLDRVVDAGEGEAQKATLAQLERSSESLRVQLANLDKSQLADEQREARKKNLNASLERNQARIEGERKRLATLTAPDPTRPAFKNKLVPLELTIVEEPEIAKAVTALQATGLLTPQPVRSLTPGKPGAPSVPGLLAPRREPLPARLGKPLPRELPVREPKGAAPAPAPNATP